MKAYGYADQLFGFPRFPDNVREASRFPLKTGCEGSLHVPEIDEAYVFRKDHLRIMQFWAVGAEKIPDPGPPVGNGLQPGVLARVLLHELLAPLVLVDGTQFRHGLKLSSSNLDHAAACCSSAASSRGNGKPNRRSSSRASSSVFAVVVTMMSIPRTFSILSYEISGKMICSFRPIA